MQFYIQMYGFLSEHQKLWHYREEAALHAPSSGPKAPVSPEATFTHCMASAQVARWLERVRNSGTWVPAPPRGGVQGFLQSPSPQAPGHPESQTEVQVLEFIRLPAPCPQPGSCTPLFRCYSGSRGARPHRVILGELHPLAYHPLAQDRLMVQADQLKHTLPPSLSWGLPW